MDLELATLSDIMLELRKRDLRFVFAGLEASNDPGHGQVMCAAQGASRQDLLRLIGQLHELFSSERDSDIND